MSTAITALHAVSPPAPELFKSVLFVGWLIGMLWALTSGARS